MRLNEGAKVAATSTDLTAFVQTLAEEELRTLVNNSPSAGAKASRLPGQEIYRELVLLCADELARRLRSGRPSKGPVLGRR